MPKRWVKDRGYIEVPDKVEKFLAAIARVYERHGLSLTLSGDGHSLAVQPLDQDDVTWLADAQVDPRVAAGLIRED